MGWKDFLVEAVAKRLGSKAAHDTVREVAGSEVAREVLNEVLQSETAKELAKEAGREVVRATGEKLKQEVRNAAQPLIGPWEERRRARAIAKQQREQREAEARAQRERQEAEERREREIDDELEAIKKKLGRT